MTDKELLELAAKAAGYFHTKWDKRDWFYVCGLEGAWLEPSDFELWNPLTIDGDAFRLAVKLNLLVHCETLAYTHAMQEDIHVTEHIGNDLTGDIYAATRRAIVRAAAEIGKDMKP
jgi:hypothetical protein